MTNTLRTIIRDKQEIKNQQGSRDEVNFVPKRFADNVRVELPIVKLVSNSVTDSFVIGNSEQAIKGETELQIVYGEDELEMVVPQGDTYQERLDSWNYLSEDAEEFEDYYKAELL